MRDIHQRNLAGGYLDHRVGDVEDSRRDREVEGIIRCGPASTELRRGTTKSLGLQIVNDECYSPSKTRRPSALSRQPTLLLGAAHWRDLQRAARGCVERPEGGRRPSDKGGLVARLCLLSRLTETTCRDGGFDPDQFPRSCPISRILFCTVRPDRGSPPMSYSAGLPPTVWL